MSSGITPAQIYQMITGVGTAFEGAFERSKQRGLDDEAEGAASRLFERQSGVAKGGSQSINFSDLGTDEGPKFNPAGKTPSFAAIEGSAPSSTMQGVAANESGRAQQAMAYLTGKGWSPAQAAGIVGNLQAESGKGLKTDAIGDNGSAFGIAQWRLDRREGLQNFARANGKDPADFMTQIAYLDNELRGSERFAGDAIRSAKTADDAAIAMIHGLRPAGYTRDNPAGGHNASVRVANARALVGSGSADAPAPGAENAQGFVIPGQAGTGRVSTGMTPELYRDLRIMMRSDKYRPMAAQLLQQMTKQRDIKTVDLGNAIGVMDNEGNIVRQIPKQRDPIAIGPEQDLIDPSSGRVIRQGQRKSEVEVKEVNGRLVLVDKNARNASDITPQGMPSGYRPMTEEERKAFGIPGETGGYIGPDGKPAALPGTTRIQNSIGGQAIEPEFNKATGKAIGERFDAISKEGDTARSDLAMVDQLRSLGGAINFKTMPALRGALAEYGVKIGDDVGEIQAYNSIIDKLTPAQRIPGSGASSDLDVRMFKSSLPRLINTPEGNTLIMDVMQAMGEDKIKRAVIAERAQTGEISPAQAINELRAMPSPLAEYKDRIEEAAKAAKEADSPAAPGKRVQLPQGYTAARALAEAKDNYGRANDAQKALIRERVRSWGIDPKRLDN